MPNFTTIGQSVSVVIIRFSIFKLAAIRLIGLLKFEILMADRVLDAERQNTSSFQISWQSVKPLLRYRPSCLLTFQNGGHPPSWICHRRVWITHEEYLMVFIVVQNLI